MTDLHTGSCLCGEVVYEIKPPYTFFQYCHCSRCRKFTGAAHSASILVLREQFRWVTGEGLVKRFEVPDAKYYCTAFCSRCGSSLPWRARDGRFFLVPAGTLDGDAGAVVQRNIHWASRASWYESVDALPFYDELP